MFVKDFYKRVGRTSAVVADNVSSYNSVSVVGFMLIVVLPPESHLLIR